jgi:hypothetical protein
MLNVLPTQSSDSPARAHRAFSSEVDPGSRKENASRQKARLRITKVYGFRCSMRITPLALLLLSFLAATPARAELHITRDHGGYVEEYKVKYKQIRDSGQRVIIDGICNSACTLVPMNKICVTPRASLGFHQAYYDKAFTFGIKVTSAEGTSDLMSYYPDTVKDWIRRNGGLTTEMKKIKNGEELWKIVDPCPEEW